METTLLPSATGAGSYLYCELDADPIAWWQRLSWKSTVEEWLPLAQGSATCVDDLNGLLRPLAIEDQVRRGLLLWVSRIVIPDAANVANRTYRLPSWLIDREAGSDAGTAVGLAACRRRTSRRW